MTVTRGPRKGSFQAKWGAVPCVALTRSVMHVTDLITALSLPDSVSVPRVEGLRVFCSVLSAVFSLLIISVQTRLASSTIGSLNLFSSPPSFEVDLVSMSLYCVTVKEQNNNSQLFNLQDTQRLDTIRLKLLRPDSQMKCTKLTAPSDRLHVL